ncbi:MAG TPA: PD-(D/E)XK nuclease family protein [Sediminispirochaeta sp.]|nr:PD-(D/E)XK nuclease family protein [Sediminispirochaeta sp.]
MDIDKVILQGLEEEGSRFVFPSEVAAEFHLRRALMNGPHRALRADRFLSWDRLKEQEFSPRRDLLPVNTLYRGLFAASLLEEHRVSGPLFQVLAGEYQPGRDVSVFEQQITAALGQSQKAVDLLQHRGDAVPRELREDLLLLHRRYLEYLNDNGLYEPAFSRPEAHGDGDRHYHLFFPELIEDFREYRGLLEGKRNYSIHGLDEFSEPAENGEVLRFGNARLELNWLIRELHRLLEEGVHPSRIALSLPDYEAWRPYLEEEARIRDIPLDFRAGRVLGDYPAGRLFQKVADLVSSGFALEELKALVLDPGYPWKREDELRELLRFALDHFYVRNWGGTSGGRRNELPRKLRNAGRDELAKLSEQLRRQGEKMVSAETARELSKEVHGFLHGFFDPQSWDPESERVLQYCLMVLRELVEAEERLSLKILSPFSRWTKLLGSRIYVSAVRREAIPVYRYRVSAGIVPSYHFIPGAGHGETRVRHEDLAFLRDDYRDLLSEEKSRDSSSAFLRVYRSSGDRVGISCSDVGFSGPQLPPGELLAAGGVRTMEETAASIELHEPWSGEELFWAGETKFPERLFRTQIEGFGRIMATGFAAKGLDLSGEQLADGELLARAGEMWRDEEERKENKGHLCLSPTSFDSYLNCPFAHLWQRGLQLEEDEYESLFVEHRHMGIILHRIFAELYRQVVAEDGRWNAEHGRRYEQMAEEICRRELAKQERRGMDFVAPSWSWFAASAREQLKTFVEQESRSFDGARYELLEDKLRVELPAAGAAIGGRVDRLGRMQEQVFLIDYKKGKAPPKGDIYQPESLPAISQLPLYVYLARRKGYSVGSASYYSFTEGGFRHVFVAEDSILRRREEKVKAFLTPEEFEELTARIVDSIQAVARQIRQGDYRARENCKSCNLRGLCRTKYNLRLPGVRSGA